MKRLLKRHMRRARRRGMSEERQMMIGGIITIVLIYAVVIAVGKYHRPIEPIAHTVPFDKASAK